MHKVTALSLQLQRNLAALKMTGIWYESKINLNKNQ